MRKCAGSHIKTLRVTPSSVGQRPCRPFMAPCHPVRDSPLIDFLEGRPIEVGPIFAEPARRARAGGIPTPGLDQLAALLARLDPARS